METAENKDFLTTLNAMGRSVAVKPPVAFQKTNKINGFVHVSYGTALNFFRETIGWKIFAGKELTDVAVSKFLQSGFTDEVKTDLKLLRDYDPFESWDDNVTNALEPVINFCERGIVA